MHLPRSPTTSSNPWRGVAGRGRERQLSTRQDGVRGPCEGPCHACHAATGYLRRRSTRATSTPPSRGQPGASGGTMSIFTPWSASSRRPIQARRPVCDQRNESTPPGVAFVISGKQGVAGVVALCSASSLVKLASIKSFTYT